jgi:ion channel
MSKLALRHSRFWSSDVNLSALLAILVLLIFVLYPLGEIGVVGAVILEAFISLLLITGIRSVTRNRMATVVMSTIAAAAMVSGWLRLIYPSTGVAALSYFFGILTLGSLVGIILIDVFREGKINFHRIQGAIAVYLLLGILWAVSYRFVDLIKPDAFQLGPRALPAAISDSDPMHRFIYFSFSTLTTIGYSDIIAVNPLARSLVMIEALVGQLFPAILIARLVSMEVSSRETRSQEPGSQESTVASTSSMATDATKR